ncbi:hypothetical protein [Nocardioides sp. J54]|uniref:hypothetical protein n=1 Tax=Nocardioides sp. J54 TaxID=935866 RepID=UPI000564F3F3|nr:hypothetical protein [Nocardioides sp. J54]
MVSQIQHFLLVFDHEKGMLVGKHNFGEDSTAALVEYMKCEERHRDNKMMDIVLIGSDSLETVMVTHANYFDGSAAKARSKYLAGI